MSGEYQYTTAKACSYITQYESLPTYFNSPEKGGIVLAMFKVFDKELFQIKAYHIC